MGGDCPPASPLSEPLNASFIVRKNLISHYKGIQLKVTNKIYNAYLSMTQVSLYMLSLLDLI